MAVCSFAPSRKAMSNSDRTRVHRVLVVDDSAFMRRVVSDLVAACGEFEVVGVARDGEDAIRQVHALLPDIVTLDIDMPGLNGLDVLGYIMSETPRAVVMLSAGGTTGGEATTLRALELGAVDFVRKPSGPISLDVARVGDRLLGALRAAAAMRVSHATVLARPVRAATVTRPTTTIAATRAVVVAASTGGPSALTQVIPGLTLPLGAAVLVVQHMPKGFTASLAQRLDGLSALRVCEAREGELIRPDTVYIAPGGVHMRVVRTVDGPRVSLDTSPAQWGVRPAADPLFVSASDVFQDQLLGVVLTGMGRDGAEGLRVVRGRGGRALVQDPEHSVIAGMPNAALRHAGADAMHVLADMPEAIHAELSRLPIRAHAERVSHVA